MLRCLFSARFSAALRMTILHGQPKVPTKEPQLCALSGWSIACSRWQHAPEVPTATRKTSFLLIPSSYGIRVGSSARCELVFTAVWLAAANLLLQRRCGLNSNYCPGWRGFKFAVTLNIFTAGRCTEVCSMSRIMVRMLHRDLLCNVNSKRHSTFLLLAFNGKQATASCDVG